jgi:cell division protein FtsB
MLLTYLLNLSAPIQRYIAVGLGLAAILLLVTSGWQSVGVLSDQNEVILQLRTQAGKLEQLAKMKGTIKNEIEKPSDGEGLLLVAASAPIARAELQTRIIAFAQGHQASVASIGDVPDIVENGLTLVGVRANISGTNDAIQKAVLEMESVMPPLLVREFSIQTSGADLPDGPSDLSVQFQVYGAMHSDVLESLIPAKE